MVTSQSAVAPVKVNQIAQLNRDLQMFPRIPVPYTCTPGTGVRLQLNLRQPFISKDPQPVSYVMYVHPAQDDIWVSKTIFENEGNKMFEMGLRGMMYKRIRGADGTYPTPISPIFVDAGANIGTLSRKPFVSSCACFCCRY